jgi:3-phytase
MRRATIWPAAVLGLALLVWPLAAQQKRDTPAAVTPTVKCSDPASRDQDDLCVWVHPTDPSRSLIVASDKAAGRLFVYDLDGKTRQALPAKHPGNIDVRYGFPLGRDKVDIVAVNQRGDGTLAVCKVDAATGRLERIDNGALRTGENYGGTLYRSRRTGKFYFLTTSYKATVEQYELADDGSGKVKGTKVRSWKVGGVCEAAVGDDEAGKVYIAEEQKGVWEVGGEPGDAAPGKLVVKRGEHGLAGDVEGLAIYHLPEGGGYLIVSDQGRNHFKVYQRSAPHAFLGAFAVRGARDTDGLDVCNVNLGPRFPNGLFACHTGEGKCPILLAPWEDVARAGGLKVDTSWGPRK